MGLLLLLVALQLQQHFPQLKLGPLQYSWSPPSKLMLLLMEPSLISMRKRLVSYLLDFQSLIVPDSLVLKIPISMILDLSMNLNLH